MNEPVSLESGGRWNWLAALPESVRSAWAERCDQVRVAPGESIYRQGDTATAIYQVLEGRVQMRAFSSDGKELLYQHMEPGDCFGELGLIDGEPYHHDASASAAARLLRLGRNEFMELRQAHPEINEQLLQLLAQRIRLIYHTFEGALLLDVPRRLAGRLLDARGPGSDLPEGGSEITCSHEDLAKMIGSSRQSVSAILKDWERQGWLEQAYGRIRLLSPQDLESLAQD
jgi:CRP-like cAMP-binding protein